MTDVMHQTPPSLTGPTEKERKYDRQLRLWAASGQQALEDAKILLVNSGSGVVGIETLKNLVLPGIGSFTIVDEAVVQDEDLGVNFFLDEESLGELRAKRCAELLSELNPEVQGRWFPHSKGSGGAKAILERLLEDPSEKFTMILYALPQPEAQVKLLQDHAKRTNTPLLAVQSAGFYSWFTVQLPGTFPIVDTHPDDSATTDLRLLSPWPALEDYAREMTRDIENLSDHDHGHLPLVVILLHYLEKWKASHDGALPTSYDDKTAFRTLVANVTRRNNPEGGEENFDEAAAAVMKHVVVPSVPAALQEVFDYQTRNTDERRSSFWIIAEAVRQFHQKHRVLPVAGGLPDMKAQSDVYIQLQNIYKAKARQDASEVLSTVRSTAGGENIESAEVELFCTNARFVKLINRADGDMPRLNLLVEQERGNDEIAAIAGPEMPTSLLPVFLALSATSHDATATPEAILSSVQERAPAANKGDWVLKAAQEVSRAAGGELHNISAVTGGMVAQEMIKVITKQYIPADNTCIFDGIASRCQVLRL